MLNESRRRDRFPQSYPNARHAGTINFSREAVKSSQSSTFRFLPCSADLNSLRPPLPERCGKTTEFATQGSRIISRCGHLPLDGVFEEFCVGLEAQGLKTNA